MSYLYPIKFSFGRSISSKISNNEIEYYKDYFSSLFGKTYKLKEQDYKSIPIEDDYSGQSFRLINEFNKIITDKYGIIIDGKFIYNDDLIVIDLRGILRSILLVYFFDEISYILQNDLPNNKNPRFVVIVDSVVNVGSGAILKQLSDYINVKKVFIIDKSKKYIYGSTSPNLSLDFSFEHISQDPLHKIKFKLIRKIGHFKRFDQEGNHHACHQFFYDGEYCIDDVKDLIVKKVIDLKSESFNVEAIFYHCPESQWLAAALYKTDIELRRQKEALSLNYNGCYDIYSPDFIANMNAEVKDVLFVFDLIHSGNQFISEFTKFKKNVPDVNVRSVSILNSFPENDSKKIRKLNIDKYITEDVEFFLSVDQQSFEADCHMCEYDLLETKNRTEYYNDDLSSYEMWLMSDDAGYINENFVPDEIRHPIDITPDSLKLMRLNAPYLAYKVDRLIKKNGLERSVSLTLIVPDETTNTLEVESRGGVGYEFVDTPVGFFVECLKHLREYQYFRIPRKIIQEIRHDKIKINEISSRYTDFYNELQQIVNDIVVIDEKCKSGETLRIILGILKQVNQKPLALFPIFNYCPTIVNSDKFDDIKVISLYSFDANEKE